MGCMLTMIIMTESWLAELALIVVIGLLAVAQVRMKTITVSRPFHKAVLFALESITLTGMVTAGAMLGAYYGGVLFQS